MIVLSSALIAVLAMTGCTTKEPVVEEEVQAAPVATVPAPVEEKEAVVPEAKIIELSETTLADLEGQMKTVNFDFDRYDIRSDMQGYVVANSNLANGEASEYAVKLEGNCDEWGSDEYNFALGLRRTNAVKAEMVAEGVEAERISMVSYGESNPVCTEKTKECWYQNRRVEVKLLP